MHKKAIHFLYFLLPWYGYSDDNSGQGAQKSHPSQTLSDTTPLWNSEQLRKTVTVFGQQDQHVVPNDHDSSRVIDHSLRKRSDGIPFTHLMKIEQSPMIPNNHSEHAHMITEMYNNLLNDQYEKIDFVNLNKMGNDFRPKMNHRSPVHNKKKNKPSSKNLHSTMNHRLLLRNEKNQLKIEQSIPTKNDNEILFGDPRDKSKVNEITKRNSSSIIDLKKENVYSGRRTKYKGNERMNNDEQSNKENILFSIDTEKRSILNDSGSWDHKPIQRSRDDIMGTESIQKSRDSLNVDNSSTELVHVRSPSNKNELFEVLTNERLQILPTADNHHLSSSLKNNDISGKGSISTYHISPINTHLLHAAIEPHPIHTGTDNISSIPKKSSDIISVPRILEISQITDQLSYDGVKKVLSHPLVSKKRDHTPLKLDTRIGLSHNEFYKPPSQFLQKVIQPTISNKISKEIQFIKNLGTLLEYLKNENMITDDRIDEYNPTYENIHTKKQNYKGEDNPILHGANREDDEGKDNPVLDGVNREGNDRGYSSSDKKEEGNLLQHETNLKDNKLKDSTIPIKSDRKDNKLKDSTIPIKSDRKDRKLKDSTVPIKSDRKDRKLEDPINIQKLHKIKYHNSQQLHHNKFKKKDSENRLLQENSAQSLVQTINIVTFCTSHVGVESELDGTRICCKKLCSSKSECSNTSGCKVGQDLENCCPKTIKKKNKECITPFDYGCIINEALTPQVIQKAEIGKQPKSEEIKAPVITPEMSGYLITFLIFIIAISCIAKTAYGRWRKGDDEHEQLQFFQDTLHRVHLMEEVADDELTPAVKQMIKHQIAEEKRKKMLIE